MLSAAIDHRAHYMTEGKRPRGRPRKISHPLARWIEEYREGDRAAFAQEIGVTKNHLDNVLRGSSDLGKEKAFLASAITGIPLEDLLDPTGEIRKNLPKSDG